MPRVRVHSVTLHYELTGSSGLPLVLVHGSWGDHHNWDAVVPLLARSFRVLTYDRRGHSPSERLPGQGSIHEDVVDLEALLQHLGLVPAHIAGNSFGASIVLKLAVKRPDLFRSLIIHEPPLIGLLAANVALQPVLQEVNQRVNTVVNLLVSGDTAGGTKQFVETIAFGPGGWDQLPDVTQRTFLLNAPTWLDEVQEQDAFTVDLSDLSSFRHPALTSYGELSPPFFLPIMRAIHECLPRAQMYHFPGAGHVPHVTHPDQYAETLSGFASVG